MTPAQIAHDRAAHHVKARHRLDAMGDVPPVTDAEGTRNYAEAFLHAASCSECAFWCRGQGQCRRHAPRVTRSAGVTESIWPRTGAGDWCGDWAQA
ncbi:hypothetical protein C3942_16840 [Solimonas fluminis]|uniref:Uncharacterized protein n=1 Tax=Solimonas fluminis TaxID=2086571 RepID=A0A2S5TCM6_9GAMM|nr:hypothetical protein [Solimonas fluminis]PPE72715.1 hypothetical protein C3942_16840 [Solimonas fluminis]